MAIPLIINNDNSFTPEDIGALVQAFEGTLKALCLVDRRDPAAVLVARTIIDLAKAGQRNPIKLRESAVSAINLSAAITPDEMRPRRRLPPVFVVVFGMFTTLLWISTLPWLLLRMLWRMLWRRL